MKLIALVLMAMVTLAFAGPAAAQAPPDLTIPIDTIETGAGVHPLSTVDTPAGLVGQECQVTATNRNQNSIHDGNDLVITSASTVRLLDVEALANLVVVSSAPITLGGSVSVSVDIGADPPVFSAGLDLTFDCEPPVTTTTTPPPPPATTTTTAPVCFDEGGNPYRYDGDPAHGPCGDVITTTTTVTTPPTTPTTEPDCGPDTLACTGPSSATNFLVGAGILALGGGLGLVGVVRWRDHHRWTQTDW